MWMKKLGELNWKANFVCKNEHANQRLIVETKESTAPQRIGHEPAKAE